ncbi:MAG: hypothetical protein V3U76_18510 [Granulosicoccus sp.]
MFRDLAQFIDAGSRCILGYSQLDIATHVLKAYRNISTHHQITTHIDISFDINLQVQ